MAQTHGSKPVYRIDTIELSLNKSNPPSLNIIANGYTRTGGWTNPQLVPRAGAQKGVVEYDFCADPPNGPAIDSLEAIQARAVHADAENVTGVVVYAENNRVSVLGPGAKLAIDLNHLPKDLQAAIGQAIVASVVRHVNTGGVVVTGKLRPGLYGFVQPDLDKPLGDLLRVL